MTVPREGRRRHSPAVLTREVVGMDGLCPIDDVVTLDGQAGGDKGCVGGERGLRGMRWYGES